MQIKRQPLPNFLGKGCLRIWARSARYDFTQGLVYPLNFQS